jgi:hypothetical protein
MIEKGSEMLYKGKNMILNAKIQRDYFAKKNEIFLLKNNMILNTLKGIAYGLRIPGV